MAFQTGTATDCFDLYEKLIAFLTADAELVGASQNWTNVWHPPHDSNSSGIAGHDIVLRGPGLTSTDQVYIGLSLRPDLLNDSAELRMSGMTGVIPSSESYSAHVNSSPLNVKCFLRGSNAMDYWFVANGRRFIMVAQVSTVYEALYGGLFLPYGDPTQYSYPLFIGGTAGANDLGGEPTDWRSVDAAHTTFHRSERVSAGSFPYGPSAMMLSPSGDWLKIAITDAQDQTVGTTPWMFGTNADFGIQKLSSTLHWGYTEFAARVIQTYDDEFVLNPIGLVQFSPSDQAYGALEGLYQTPGRGNSAENIITADGVAHVAFPNVFRTGIDQFYAVALGDPEDSNS